MNLTKRAKEICVHGTSEEIFVDGALVVVPYYNKPTEEGLITHFRAIAEVGLPIVLYDIPGRTGIQMSAEAILKLAEEKSIIGLKWASGDTKQLKEILKHCPEDFTVLSGDDNRTIELMKEGGNGVISVVSNLIPGSMKKFIDSAREKNWSLAQEWHGRLLGLMKAIFIVTNPIPVKTAMSMVYPEKFGANPGFRLPLCSMNAKKLKELSAVISEYRKNGILPKK